MDLPQIPFLSLEIKASSDAITDVGTALPICWSLSPFPGSTELELAVGNLFLSFCQIHPWKLGRFPWDLVLLLSLVLAMGTCSHHPHHTSTLNISGALPAFHHPSFVFGFISAAVLLLPDVTHVPQKVGLLLSVLSLGF